MSLGDLAAAYRIPHLEVGDVDGLRRAVTSPVGLQIVEVRTDRDRNAALHDRLRDAAAAAVADLALGRDG